MVLLAVALAFTASTPLTVRAARVPIQPSERLPLGGYTERGGKLDVPGGDVLNANVVVLSQRNTTIILESLETLTIPHSLYEAVQSKLPSNVHLFLSATHTHCAPDSQMLNSRMTFAIPGIASFKRSELAWYADKLADAAEQALHSTARQVTKVVAETWNAPCNRPRRKGGRPDQTATMLHFIAGDKPGSKSEVDIFEYAAHPTFYEEDELKTREDWPGGANNLSSLVWVGAIGDVSPRAPDSDKGTAQAKIARFWQVILQTRAHSKKQTVWQPGAGRLGWSESEVALPKPTPNPTFAKAYKIPEALAKLLVTQFAPTQSIVRGFALGRLAVVGIPGEPSSILGRHVDDYSKKMGFYDGLCLSHVDGWSGYLLDPADYARGGYEATLNFYGPQGGEKFVLAANKVLDQLGRAERS